MHRLATLALVAVVAAGCGKAREVKDPRGAQQDAYGCDRCHGYPPAPGWLAESVAHPSSTNCSYCHPQTVMDDGTNHTLIPASQGGRHQNGHVDYVHGHEPKIIGGTSTPYARKEAHAPDALLGLGKQAGAQDCYVCHGSDLTGGIGPNCVSCHSAPLGDPRFPKGVADFRTNCTFCHGQAKEPFTIDTDLGLAAPPVALIPHDPADPAIGAHQGHLNTALTNLGLETPGVADRCATCHTIPGASFPGSLDHLADSQVVKFAGMAVAGGATTSYDETTLTCATYCHGATMAGGTATAPKWTDASVTCSSCHGSPPPTGGGTTGTAWHTFHVSGPPLLNCSKCHLGYVKDTSVDPALHINGTADVIVDDGGVTPGGWKDMPVNNNADHSWTQDQCVACHTHLGIPLSP